MINVRSWAAVRSISIIAFCACGTPSQAGRHNEIDAAVAQDADTPDVSLPCRLIVIAGQSNAAVPGLSSELPPGQGDLASPYATVQEAAELGRNTIPITWDMYPISAMQPRLHAGVVGFSFELTMARDLPSSSTWIIGKSAVDATNLARDWNPTSQAATPNTFTQHINWIDDLIATTGCPIYAYVWEQGERDAGAMATANSYGANLAAFVDALRAHFGPVPFIYGRLNSAYQGSFTSTVQAGQDALPSIRSDVHEVNQDAFALRSDGLHYTTVSVLGLGHLFATEVTALQ